YDRRQIWAEEGAGVGEVDQTRGERIKKVERVVDALNGVAPAQTDDRVADGIGWRLDVNRNLESELAVVEVVEEADDLIRPVMEAALDRSPVTSPDVDATPDVIKILRDDTHL